MNFTLRKSIRKIGTTYVLQVPLYYYLLEHQYYLCSVGTFIQLPIGKLVLPMFRRYLYITTYGTNRNIGTYVRTLTIQNIGTYDIENVEFKIEKDFFQQVLREIFDASMTQYAIWHVFGTYSGPPPTRDLTPSSPCSKKLTPSRRSNHRYIAFGRKTGLRILLLRVRESL